MDTMILQHLENENSQSFSLTNLIAQNFGGHDAYAKEGKLGAVINTVPFSSAAKYVHLDARWTWLLYTKLRSKLNFIESIQPAIQQESDVLRVIMEMEDEGITVNTASLKLLRKELDGKMRECLLDIVDNSYAGFNPDSNKDKQTYLFTGKRQGGLGLKPSKRCFLPMNVPFKGIMPICLISIGREVMVFQNTAPAISGFYPIGWADSWA
jgi:DNA polymerase I-like protein with 3'-5' exonuclease and polymerase domains